MENVGVLGSHFRSNIKLHFAAENQYLFGIFEQLPSVKININTHPAFFVMKDIV